MLKVKEMFYFHYSLLKPRITTTVWDVVVIKIDNSNCG